MIDTRWQSLDGREFYVVDVQGDWVWYRHKDTTYHCLIEAFKQRFKRIENNHGSRSTNDSRSSIVRNNWR